MVAVIADLASLASAFFSASVVRGKTKPRPKPLTHLQHQSPNAQHSEDDIESNSEFVGAQHIVGNQSSDESGSGCANREEQVFVRPALLQVLFLRDFPQLQCLQSYPKSATAQKRHEDHQAARKALPTQSVNRPLLMARHRNDVGGDVSSVVRW